MLRKNKKKTKKKMYRIHNKENMIETKDNNSDFEDREVYGIIDYTDENHNYKVNKIDMTFDKAIKLLMKGSIG